MSYHSYRLEALHKVLQLMGTLAMPALIAVSVAVNGFTKTSAGHQCLLDHAHYVSIGAYSFLLAAVSYYLSRLYNPDSRAKDGSHVWVHHSGAGVMGQATVRQVYEHYHGGGSWDRAKAATRWCLFLVLYAAGAYGGWTALQLTVFAGKPLVAEIAVAVVIAMGVISLLVHWAFLRVNLNLNSGAPLPSDEYATWFLLGGGLILLLQGFAGIYLIARAFFAMGERGSFETAWLYEGTLLLFYVALCTEVLFVGLLLSIRQARNSLLESPE